MTFKKKYLFCWKELLGRKLWHFKCNECIFNLVCINVLTEIEWWWPVLTSVVCKGIKSAIQIFTFFFKNTCWDKVNYNNKISFQFWHLTIICKSSRKVVKKFVHISTLNMYSFTKELKKKIKSCKKLILSIFCHYRNLNVHVLYKLNWCLYSLILIVLFVKLCSECYLF